LPLECLDFSLEKSVVLEHIVFMLFADLQIFGELLVNFLNLVVFGINEVDLCAGLLKLDIKLIGLILLLV